jgi:hypothetical protein
MQGLLLEVQSLQGCDYWTCRQVVNYSLKDMGALGRLAHASGSYPVTDWQLDLKVGQ